MYTVTTAWMGWKVFVHIVLLKPYGRICALCVGIVNILRYCKNGKKDSSWFDIFLSALFLWFFLLNWTWCSFFADTKLISLRRFRRYVSLCSFMWRNAPPYLVSKMQRLHFSVDSELMALYDSFPHPFIAVCSVTLNHLMTYSESCFMCW